MEDLVEAKPADLMETGTTKNNRSHPFSMEIIDVAALEKKRAISAAEARIILVSSVIEGAG